MAKKGTKVTVVLDELDFAKGEIGADEMTKLKAAKYEGGNKKLPSLTARTMGTAMLKNPAVGQFIDVSKFTADIKEAAIRVLKKDLSKVARAHDKKELRIRSIDQGNRVVFFYDVKKVKVNKGNGPKVAAVSGKK